ncbi:hypothetical protein GCM10023336_15880 [Streptomyces similanensis]|uniref:DUF2637 domain-containing protein n=2 Tax=Streptomyces similanensis TaxID=1274988 RepID=A0ABP9K2P8_9ACTN
MYDERIDGRPDGRSDGRFDGRFDGRPGYSTDYPYVYPASNPYLNPYLDGSDEESTPGTGRHRAPTQYFSGPLIPPDSAWDPAEELAFMLQDALAHQQWPTATDPRDGLYQPPQPQQDAQFLETDQSAQAVLNVQDAWTVPPDTPPDLTAPAPAPPEAAPAPDPALDAPEPEPRPDPTPGPAPEPPDARESTPTPTDSPPAGLQAITDALPPLRDTYRGHRRIRERKRPDVIRTASRVLAAAAAVTASSVSFFGGMVAYEPLRVVAVTRMHDGIASWWPLLVYGPWLVASLSVLRAALHRRRALHSWCVVLLFSSIATLLCVIQAPRTIVDMSAATLPGLASLACFQQLVRQITLTRPPRRRAPRHRVRRTPQPETTPTSKPAKATAKPSGA